MSEEYWKEAAVEQIFLCSCHGEGIVLESDEDNVYLGIWGFHNNVSLWWRVKQAYAALRGRASTQIVLNHATARKLMEHLDTLSQEAA